MSEALPHSFVRVYPFVPLLHLFVPLLDSFTPPFYLIVPLVHMPSQGWTTRRGNEKGEFQTVLKGRTQFVVLMMMIHIPVFFYETQYLSNIHILSKLTVQCREKVGRAFLVDLMETLFKCCILIAFQMCSLSGFTEMYKRKFIFHDILKVGEGNTTLKSSFSVIF